MLNRALVTGGAGFIGSSIVEVLLDAGCEVRVLDNLSSGSLENLASSSHSKLFTFMRADINDKTSMMRAVKDVDVIFHEAAVVSVRRSILEPSLTHKVNVGGTRNLLECATSSSVNQVVFASSAAVYGNPRVLPLKADSPRSPISPYGSSKAAAEALCLDSHRATGIGVTVLRYFNVYGPRSKFGIDASVVNRFAETLSKFRPLNIIGDGLATRDFVYVNDVAEANLAAALRRGHSSAVYNIGTGCETTIIDLARRECSILFGPKFPLRVEYAPRTAEEIVRSCADISLTSNALGFKHKYTLDRGLLDYLSKLFPSLPLKWDDTRSAHRRSHRKWATAH